MRSPRVDAQDRRDSAEELRSLLAEVSHWSGSRTWRPDADDPWFHDAEVHAE